MQPVRRDLELWPLETLIQHPRTKLCGWVQRFGPLACSKPEVSSMSHLTNKMLTSNRLSPSLSNQLPPQPRASHFIKHWKIYTPS